ncbi:putative transmembrane protein [Candidatus Burkholderia verschuerenii]|uniref:Putative transmembrane protein n=2 Tax=Candidatus Burkholderia verschuerenii TaxID=242163 RepID=A0A0L0MIE9_9BURK|nr:putative transmembrane protein [Candidatus Burkholderia verschuerenii]
MWCAACADALAENAPTQSFAVVANALTRPADEAPVRQMLDAIGRDRDISFIVYDGNVKGSAEACRDGIFEARHDVLDSARTPLVLLLGQHDWADCGTPQAGGYDPVERLDFVRQLFFPDANSLGQSPLTLARESDVARFRTFREIVRWQDQGVAFIGLNAPSPNNHYLSAGGRNGEFEDRAVATSFWLEHAAETARRTEMRALVVILQGDPDFSRYERRERFPWLRFSRSSQPRDGFLELKRNLVKAAEAFRGPVIVIHGTDTPEPNGFHIDQPLRNDKGLTVTNLTRVAVALKRPQSQWLEVQSDSRWRPPFRLRVRDIRDVRKRDNAEPPSQIDTPATQPTMPSSAPPAQPQYLPPPPTLPQPASELPPIYMAPPPASVQPSLPPIADLSAARIRYAERHAGRAIE